MGLTLPIPGPLQYGNSGTDIRIVVHEIELTTGK